MYKYLLLVWLLTGCGFWASAQNPDTIGKIKVKAKDTVISTKRDTAKARMFKPKKIKTYNPDSLHNPHTAVIHSLIIPGWGQVYNHQVWKVPIIYGGLGGLAYSIIFANSNYKTFLAISILRQRGIKPAFGEPNYDNYNLYVNVPITALNDETDFYRRNRDLSILGVFLLWGVNAVDAYVAAKFIHSYTVDENFSMRVTPTLINQPMYASTSINANIPGIKITFTLK